MRMLPPVAAHAVHAQTPRGHNCTLLMVLDEPHFCHASRPTQESMTGQATIVARSVSPSPAGQTRVRAEDMRSPRKSTTASGSTLVSRRKHEEPGSQRASSANPDQSYDSATAAKRCFVASSQRAPATPASYMARGLCPSAWAAS